MTSEDEFAAPQDDEEELFDSAVKMTEALHAGGIGLWDWHLRKGSIELDAQARRLLDLPKGDGPLTDGQFEKAIHPEDLEAFRRSVQISLGSIGELAEAYRLNRGNDQPTRWVCLKGRVLEHDAAGRPVRAKGVAWDVTDSHHEKEASDLLNRELGHRMKNLFSVVSSIAAVSVESHPEAKEFVETFQSRLNSLAAAHDLLKERQQLSMPLADLAARVIEPLGVLNRIDIEASRLMFGGYDMQTLVLVLHELATNALKYGALSNDKGRVALRFEAEMADNRQPSHFLMTWQERAGPTVSAPTGRGFGMTLLERLAKRHGHGAPVVEWRQCGLLCRLRFRIGLP